MRIKSGMGISADGLVSTPQGVPAIAVTAGYESGGSHGYPQFIEGCDAVVMGRTTFLPARGAPQWPWAGLPVSPQGAPPVPLTLLRAEPTFPDGSAELVYTPHDR